MGLLDGVRVLDLTRLLPGPYCTLVLADLGASVVKVEDPGGGDYARYAPPLAGEQSGIFHAFNRNKRSLAMNLKAPGAAGAFRRLSRSYDVVVEGFRPGVMERLGIGWSALSSENPRLVLCSLSGYGQTGPMRGRAGHDINYIALAGLLGLCGQAGGPPQLPGVQIADIAGGGLTGAMAILAALFARERTGRGAWLDISLTEGAMALYTLAAGRRIGGAELGRGQDPLDGSAPCYGVYQTRDQRWMTLGCVEPKFWEAWCAAAGRPELVAEQYVTGEDGARARQRVAEAMAERTRAEWEAIAVRDDLPLEPVLEGDEVAAHPQHRARDMFIQIKDPIAGAIREVRSAVRVAGESGPPLAPAPALGAHTRAVLEEAGFGEGEIAALREAGAVAGDDRH